MGILKENIDGKQMPLNVVWNKLEKTSISDIMREEDRRRYILARGASVIAPFMMVVSYITMSVRHNAADIENLKDFPTLCCFYLALLMQTSKLRQKVRSNQMQNESSEMELRR